ncbi:MAG: hypothetical protein LQ352_001056 [Teloschistes flavicans]|nr:MAG: hypothetical protein LQ352_001056 [Teloschistes flavicans]
MTETISLESVVPISTISNTIGVVCDDAARSHSSPRLHQELDEQAIVSDVMEISGGRTAVIIGLLFGTTIVGSFSTGLLTVGLPHMASDLKLADNLLLWPANITGQLSHIKEASTIALLSISMALIPAFVFWIGRQERHNKPALVPNSLWKSSTFSSICVTVLLSWAVLNGMEWFCSLFFQDVQKLSARDTSLRFIPDIVSGAIINISIGVFIQRLRVDYLILITSIIAAVSPLLMALTNPAWPYWYTVFWAMLLGPFSADVLFTVAALLITDVFPENTQALGGAVFQTVAQIGTSLGLAIMANISTSVTNHSDYQNKTSPAALLEGYRVTFWVSFVWMILATIIGGLGLRTAGKIGLKRE